MWNEISELDAGCFGLESRHHNKHLKAGSFLLLLMRMLRSEILGHLEARVIHGIDPEEAKGGMGR